MLNRWDDLCIVLLDIFQDVQLIKPDELSSSVCSPIVSHVKPLKASLCYLGRILLSDDFLSSYKALYEV